ncbi:MAG: glycosyltransferase family 4 protein [Tepidisphaeraceae bacterium]
MRIFYDHPIFTIQIYGGVSRYFHEIIPRIAAMRDSRVSVFMGLHLNRFGLERHRDRFAHFAGLRLPAMSKAHRFIRAADDIAADWFTAAHDFDVFHSTYFRTRPTSPARVRITTVHDLMQERIPESFGLPRSQCEWIRKFTLAFDGLICVSHNTARDVMHYWKVPRHKIAVVHHGNSLHGLRSGERIVERPYLLYVGMRHEYKGFRRLLETYARLPGVRDSFDLVCTGAGAFNAAEMDQIERLGLAQRVRFVRGGDDRRLVTLYSHAAALVYPSLYEGFGIPILEAFGCGCPVVSSDRSSLPEVGGDAALYFDPEQPDDMAAKLSRILEDQALRTRLIRAGREREKQFTWESAARQTREFYQRILEG